MLWQHFDERFCALLVDVVIVQVESLQRIPVRKRLSKHNRALAEETRTRHLEILHTCRFRDDGGDVHGAFVARHVLV